MRGLKQWIFYRHYDIVKSHLLQMRGLKPLFNFIVACPEPSHLLQMRGLKLGIS